MRAVDANVLIRALTGDDPVHRRMAREFIRVSGSVWVSHVVLIETVWVLDSVYG